MAGFNQSRENLILDAGFGGAAYSEAEENWLALVTAPIGPEDTGATIAEATYTGYTRIPAKSTDFGAAEKGEKTNVNAFTFPECTALPDSVVGAALLTAEGIGEGEIIHDFLVVEFTTVIGKTPDFKVGALVARLKRV